MLSCGVLQVGREELPPGTLGGDEMACATLLSIQSFHYGGHCTNRQANGAERFVHLKAKNAG